MKAFKKRVGFALAGWRHFFATEANGQIQAAVAMVVVVAGIALGITTQEWLWVLLCIGMVIGLEMVNTAMEALANRLHPEQHPAIKVVKDVAAGAVLWAAVVSVIVGGVIFIPKVWAAFY
jgi:diacylglycerol kinase